MRRIYLPRRFSAAQMDTIQKVNQICESMASRGFSLTLRQVYYQFVSRAWLENTFRNYKNLGNLITIARRAGEIDWSHITDRGRNLVGTFGGLTDPAQTINPLYFSVPMWEGQRERVEVWVEKEALVDVVSRGARQFRVPYFACKGYTSDTEMWAAAQRLEGYLGYSDKVTILHLGDHDPSGIDMTRDITERLEMFISRDLSWSYANKVEVKRIALNMDQIELYNPPPNYAKVTDSRSGPYIEEFGDESWELDALDPQVIVDLIVQHIEPMVDADAWAAQRAKEVEGRATLTAIKDHYDDLIDHLVDNGWVDEAKEKVSDDDEEIEYEEGEETDA